MTGGASLYPRIKKLNKGSRVGVSAAIIKKLSNSKYNMHTLTFDNDRAFIIHQEIGKELDVDTYFSRPFIS